MQKIWIGFSTKSYFSHRQLIEWLEAASIQSVPDSVVRFVIPSLPSIPDALLASRGNFAVGAQDVSSFAAGPHTGDTPATLLCELGVSLIEIGHAEQRQRGLSDSEIASKVARVQDSGMRVLLCVGEPERSDPETAAAFCLGQIRASGAKVENTLVAYEPVWAIGASEPAATQHILETVRAVRAELKEQPLAILYGGTAGPGLLAELFPEVNGLFLGRRAHDPHAFNAVVAEAGALLPRE